MNTGCANAGTGEQGIANAQETCERAAEIIGCSPEQVLPFSTGVIMEQLPMDRLLSGIEDASRDLSRNNWVAAAQAIMTTVPFQRLSPEELLWVVQMSRLPVSVRVPA